VDKISWSAYIIALAYLDGNSVIKKDVSLGMQYLKKSAEMQDPLALVKLAKIKYHGLYNQTVNKEESLKYFELATKEYEDVFFNDIDLYHTRLASSNH